MLGFGHIPSFMEGKASLTAEDVSRFRHMRFVITRLHETTFFASHLMFGNELSGSSRSQLIIIKIMLSEVKYEYVTQPNN
jgi:hypothetical protein